jgi:prepilin-type N-terminal cleavage/methylation domain-containing protein
MTHRTQRRSAFSMIELMVAISIIAILAAITLSVGSAVMESADKRKTQDMLSLLDAALIEYEQHTGRPMTFGQGDGPGGQTYDDKPFDDLSRYDIPVRGVYTQTQPDGTGFLEEFDVGPDDFDSWETTISNRAGRRMMIDVLARLKSVESSRSILAKITSKHWQDLDAANPNPDTRYIIDAWGRPVVVVFGGRDWYTGFADTDLNDKEANGDLLDKDRTIRTFEERTFGPARGKRTYFLSAGPDQRYGWVGFQIGTDQPFLPAQDDVRYRRTEDNMYSYEVRQW